MRAAPAVRVSVTRFGAWRAALGLVLATAWIVAGAWVVSHRLAQLGPATTTVAVVGGTLALLSAWLVAGLARVVPFDLRWDGHCWFLGDVGAPSVDAVAGDVRVAIDLGGWLLLHFVPERPARGAGSRWLPVQRRGLALDWHGLRCAVHSPRPRPRPVDAAGAQAE